MTNLLTTRAARKLVPCGSFIYFYPSDSQESDGCAIRREAITPTCFRRYRDIAVRLIFLFKQRYWMTLILYLVFLKHRAMLWHLWRRHFVIISATFVGNMAQRFRARSLIDMVWVQIQPWSCCCALGKGTLRYFLLLGGLTSSSKLKSYVSLLKKKKINRTAISRYLRKQVGVIASLCIAPPSLSCKSGG